MFSYYINIEDLNLQIQGINAQQMLNIEMYKFKISMRSYYINTVDVKSLC